MRTILTLAVIAGLGASGIALADNQRGSDAGAQRPSISAADMKVSIDRLGYDVRALRTDGEVYKAYLIDRQSGDAVKAAFDEKTGELIGAKLARDDSATDRKEASEHREKRPQEESREHKRRGSDD